MTYPNTLIFVDFPSTEPTASAAFYEAVFGGRSNLAPRTSSTASCPARTSRSTTGRRARPATCTWASSTSPTPVRIPIRRVSNPATVATDGHSARVWILVSEDDSIERILTEATSRGATLLWKDHYWAEFNGFNAAFLDPWGNTFVLWTKGGDNPEIPEGWTNE